MNTTERTQGDGSDNSNLNAPPSLESMIHSDVGAKRSLKILHSLKPVEPSSKVHYLTPKHTYRAKPAPNYFVQKQKEPKFVPCEPYKAAVEPMVNKKSVTKSHKKVDRNDMDLQNLVSQLSETRKMEMAKLNEDEDIDEVDNAKLRLQWKKEKEQYETDIQNLQSSNSLLENQLKFQAQVNSELKTLLVAAVGEDLENRVQHLTEDKLSLARELLKSANHLTSHQEQTEWLAGQCEVWKSKFLASSLMVEELARWKSALMNRINEIQEVTKTLLEERKKMHSQQIDIFETLYLISKYVTKDISEPPTIKYGNILDVTSVNVELVRNLKDSLNVDIGIEDKLNHSLFSNLQQTLAEKIANRLLNNLVTISNKPDALCKAVLGAASSVGKEQVFLQYTSLHPCCSHCKGNLQNI